MDARLITAEDHTKSVYACAYGADDAANLLGVSAATVRREAKRLGVRKIAGPAVAGFVLFPWGPRGPVSMAYYA